MIKSIVTAKNTLIIVGTLLTFLFLFEWFTNYLDKLQQYETYEHRFLWCRREHGVAHAFSDSCVEAEKKISVYPSFSSLKTTIENLLLFNVPMGIFSFAMQALSVAVYQLSWGAIGMVVTCIFVYLSSGRTPNQPIIQLPEYAWQMLGNKEPLHSICVTKGSKMKQKL